MTLYQYTQLLCAIACLCLVNGHHGSNCALSCVQFFNSMLVVGDSSESELGHSLYDLIYELYAIDSSLLLSVLPQLEHKLRVRDTSSHMYLVVLLCGCRLMTSMREGRLLKSLLRCFPLRAQSWPRRTDLSGTASWEGIFEVYGIDTDIL